MSERIVISAAARTPVGKFQGALSPMRAPELGATVVRAVMERAVGPSGRWMTWGKTSVSW